MSEEGTWRHVEAAGAEFEAPVDLVPTSEQGIDGTAAVLEGGGLRLTLDGSPFADPLTGHGSKPRFTQWSHQVEGEEREIVSFAAEEETQVFATRLPGLTATIQVPRGADPEIALRILGSIRPT